MQIEIAFAAVGAGMIYVLVPRPATLAALGLSATQGRAACARFLAAHLAGDLLWSVLALLAIVGVSRLGPELFDALGLACGLYLIWLGCKALRADSGDARPVLGNPVRVGLVFGLTNPKAYPFALAMFTTLLGRYGEALSLERAPALIACVFLGFVFADVIVVAWTGLRPIGRLFTAYRTPITRATGVLFLLFGAKSIGDALAQVRARG